MDWDGRDGQAGGIYLVPNTWPNLIKGASGTAPHTPDRHDRHAQPP
jgi:hypothetical protein